MWRTLFFMVLLLVPRGAAAQAGIGSCLEGSDPAGCLSAFSEDTPGLKEGWMELAIREVKAVRFEEAARAFDAAGPGTEGLALWARHAAGEEGLFPGVRSRARALRILERDSLDAGALLLVGGQDVTEIWRRRTRAALPAGFSAETVNTQFSAAGRFRGQGARFSNRYRGVDLDMTVSDNPEGSRLYPDAEARLLAAASHPVLGAFAFRELARLYLASEDLLSLGEAATDFRREFPTHYLGYLVGSMVASWEGRPEAAATLAQLGMDLMDELSRARLLDPSGVVSTAERPPEDVAAWWSAHDPIAMTLRNERLVEHVRRWTYAELRFGSSYGPLHGAHTSPGQVVVRYGIPEMEIQFTGDSPAGGGRQGTEVGMDRFGVFHYPAFDFRFMDMGKTGDWAFYSPHASSYQGGRANTEVRSADYVLLARERFRDTPFLMEPTWETAEVYTSVFLSQQGGWDVVLTGMVPSEMGKADNGALVVNDRGRVVSRRGQVITNWREGQPFSTTFRVDPPNSGDAPSSELQSPSFAGRVESVRAPSLEAPERTIVFESELSMAPQGGRLAVSSVLLADLVTEADSDPVSEGIVRRGLHIHPSGDRSFPDSAPAYAYFEVYGLTRNAEGQTDFEVTATLDPAEGNRSFLGRILGGGNGSVGAGFRSTGSLTDTGEYILLDPGTGSAGDYLLTLHVEDSIARKSVETTTRVRFR